MPKKGNGDYCPICGVWFERWPEHRCKPAVYRGIDAANTRACNAEDDESDKSWHFVFPDYAMRLKRGFRMLGDGF